MGDPAVNIPAGGNIAKDSYATVSRKRITRVTGAIYNRAAVGERAWCKRSTGDCTIDNILRPEPTTGVAA